MTLSFCAICRLEKECIEFYTKSKKILVCRLCRRKLELRRLYELKIKEKEISVRKAIIELIEKEYKKEDIQFILEISDIRFEKEINRLRNLVKGRKEKGRLYEKFLPKKS